MGITRQQHDTLLKPINGTRIAHRSQGGKQLSYLEAWDVRAHLIRVFGFGNFDIHAHDVTFLYENDVEIGARDDRKPGKSVAFSAMVTVTVRDQDGRTIASHTDGSVGEFTGPPHILADLYDNALKTAISDGLKRACLNWGDQFGLSLYDNGSTRGVVKGTLVVPNETAEDEVATAHEVAARIETGEYPEGTLFLVVRPEPDLPVAPVTDETPEQTQRIADSLGVDGKPATVLSDDPEGSQDPSAAPAGSVEEAVENGVSP